MYTWFCFLSLLIQLYNTANSYFVCGPVKFQVTFAWASYCVLQAWSPHPVLNVVFCLLIWSLGVGFMFILLGFSSQFMPIENFWILKISSSVLAISLMSVCPNLFILLAPFITEYGFHKWKTIFHYISILNVFHFQTQSKMFILTCKFSWFSISLISSFFLILPNYEFSHHSTRWYLLKNNRSLCLKYKGERHVKKS